MADGTDGSRPEGTEDPRPSAGPGRLSFRGVLVAAILAATGGVFFLSLVPARSTYMLLQIDTEAISFRLKDDEALPVFSARGLKVPKNCADGHELLEVASASSEVVSSLSGGKMAHGQRIGLSAEDEVVQVILAEPEQHAPASEAADCSKVITFQAAGPLQQVDAFGKVQTVTEVRIPEGGRVLLSDDEAIGAWKQVAVSGNLEFVTMLSTGEGVAPQVQVSALQTGEYVFPGFQAEPTKLFPGQDIRLRLRDGVINELSWRDDHFVVSLNGVVDEFKTIAGGKERSLLPTEFDRLKQSVIPVILAVMAGIIALFLDWRSAMRRSE